LSSVVFKLNVVAAKKIVLAADVQMEHQIHAGSRLG
jgi:hypothetical protein